MAVYLLITLPLSLAPVVPSDPALPAYLRYLGEIGVGRLHLASVSRYDLLVFAHGYRPAAPQLLDLFTSFFLHGGLAHLAGNMLFLFIYGRNVEHRLGRIGFLAAYLATGVAATLAFALFAGDSNTPLVGASGAISGVLGLYFVLFPRNRVKLLFGFPPFFFDVFLVPARLVLGFYVLVDNLLPLLVGAGGGVAYGAHLGGFLAGVLAGWTGERLSWQWPWKDPNWRLGFAPTGRDEGFGPADPVLERLRAALESGDRGAGVAAVAHLSTHQAARLAPADCVLLARWLRDAGSAIAASNLLRVCIAAHPRSPDLADLYLALGLMRLEQGQPTAAFQHLLSVFDHAPDARTAQRAREALAVIDYHRRRGWPGLP